MELAPKAQVLEGDIVKFRVSELVFLGVFKRYSTVDAMLFRHNTRNPGNNAIEMLQALHDIPRFERFKDLNVFKNVFNVIQNWNRDDLQFYLMVLIFC